jgi:hypothetical protein
VLLPTVEHVRELVAQEAEELLRLGQPLAATGVTTDQVSRVPHRLFPHPEHGEPGGQDGRPGVLVVDPVELGAGAGGALLEQEASGDEVAHRARHRRRADAEPLGEVGGGVPVGVLGQRVGEDPRRHPRHPALGQHRGQLVHRLVEADGVLCLGPGREVHGIHYIHKTVNGAMMAS